MQLAKNLLLFLCAQVSVLCSRFYKKNSNSAADQHYVFVDCFSSPLDAGRRTTDEFASIIGREYRVDLIDINIGIKDVYREIKKLHIQNDTLVYVRSPGYMIRLMVVELLLWTKLNIVYYTGDVYHLRLKSEAKFTGGAFHGFIKYFLYKYLEKCIWGYATCVLSPCLSEAAYVKKTNVNSFVLPIRFFPISELRKKKCRPILKNLDIINFVFVGGYSHPPNRAAVNEIVENLMPRLSKKIPKSRCFIIGKGWDSANYSNQHNVVFTGMVSDKDLDVYLSEAHFMLAPLPFGAGVKGKVIEGMSYGIITVTNYFGWQGINADFAVPLEKLEEQLEFIYHCIGNPERFEFYKNMYMDFLIENYSDHLPFELHKSLMNTVSKVKK